MAISELRSALDEALRDSAPWPSPGLRDILERTRAHLGNQGGDLLEKKVLELEKLEKLEVQVKAKTDEVRDLESRVRELQAGDKLDENRNRSEVKAIMDDSHRDMVAVLEEKVS